MKLLFICLDYYPYSGPCTNILKNLFSSYFEEYRNGEVEVHVLTIVNSISDSRYEVSDGVIIHRILIEELVPKWHLKKLLRQSPRIGLLILFHRIIFIIWKRLHQEEFLNPITTRKIIKGLADIPDDIDAVIPVAAHFGTVDAALKNREEQKDKLPKIIVMMMDPCSTSRFASKKTYGARYSLESKMLEEADSILALNTTYDELIDLYPANDTKNVFRFEVPNVRQLPFIDTIRKHESEIVCAYVGGLDRKVRDPNYILEVFSRLKQGVQLYLIGVNEYDIPLKYRDCSNIMCLGKKTIDETHVFLGQADFLINIGNNSLNQIPSKLFEYISQGKPIINSCKSTECPTIPYMERYPLSLNVFETDGVETTINKVSAFIEENIGKSIPFGVVETIYAECTPKYVCKQIIDLVKKPV